MYIQVYIHICMYMYYICVYICMCTNVYILLITGKNKFIIKISSQSLTARKNYIFIHLYYYLKAMELTYRFISYQRERSCYNCGYQIRSRNTFNKFILQLLLSEQQLNCAFSLTMSFIPRIAFSQPCFKIRSVLFPCKTHHHQKVPYYLF